MSWRTSHHGPSGAAPTPPPGGFPPAGYRLYVDELMQGYKLSVDETKDLKNAMELKMQEFDKVWTR